MTEIPPIVERILALALLLGLVLLVAVVGMLPFAERARNINDALEFNREMIVIRCHRYTHIQQLAGQLGL